MKRVGFFTILSKVMRGIILENALCSCFVNHYIVNENAVMKFPIDSGISGKVFKEDKTIYLNGEKLEKGFADIDNTESCNLIRSFIFVPLHNSEGKTNGILQLYNKKEGNVSKADSKGLELLQNTLGRLLDSIIELNDALDFMLMAKMTISNIIKQTNFQATALAVLPLFLT